MPLRHERAPKAPNECVPMIVMPLIVRGRGVCVSSCLLGVDLCLFKVIGIKLDCESALNIGGQCVRLESRVEEVSQRAAEQEVARRRASRFRKRDIMLRREGAGSSIRQNSGADAWPSRRIR